MRVEYIRRSHQEPFNYEPYPPDLVGGKRKIMIGSTSGREVIRFKVEETLKELMHIDSSLSKDDWRVRAIHAEISRIYDAEQRNSCISDEEVRAYVEKYFLLNSILDKETHRIDENDWFMKKETPLEKSFVKEDSA